MKKTIFFIALSVSFTSVISVYALEGSVEMEGDTELRYFVEEHSGSVSGLNKGVFDQYKDAHERYKSIKDIYDLGVSPEKSAEINEQMLVRAKEMMGLKLDALVNFLDNLESRIDEADTLGLAQKTAVSALINAYKTKVGEYRAQVNATTTMSELRNVHANMVVETKAVLGAVRSTSIYLHFLGGRAILTKASTVLDSMELHIIAAKDVGHDVTEVEDLYEVASAKLDAAFEKYGEVFESLQQIALTENFTSEFLEVTRASLVEANGLLREGVELLKEVSSLLKALYEEEAWSI